MKEVGKVRIAGELVELEIPAADAPQFYQYRVPCSSQL